MCEDKQTKGLSQKRLEALAQGHSIISQFNERQLELTRQFVEFLIEPRRRQPPDTSSSREKVAIREARDGNTSSDKGHRFHGSLRSKTVPGPECILGLFEFRRAFWYSASQLQNSKNTEPV